MQNFSPLGPKLWPAERKNRQKRPWIYTTLLSWHVLAIRYPFMSGWFMLQSPRLDACSRAIFAARTRWGRTTYSLICVVVLRKPRPARPLFIYIHTFFLFFYFLFLSSFYFFFYLCVILVVFLFASFFSLCVCVFLFFFFFFFSRILYVFLYLFLSTIVGIYLILSVCCRFAVVFIQLAVVYVFLFFFCTCLYLKTLSIVITWLVSQCATLVSHTLCVLLCKRLITTAFGVSAQSPPTVSI